MSKKLSNTSNEVGYNKVVFIVIMLLSIIMIVMMWFASREYYNALREDEFQKDVMVNMDLIQKKMITTIQLLKMINIKLMMLIHLIWN